MSQIDINEIKWTGNSRKMYDEILAALPVLYRAVVKKKFESIVGKSQTKVITESDIEEAIKEYAPNKYLKELMPIYNKYKSES